MSFDNTEISISAGGKGTVVLTVTPVAEAERVEYSIADEKVVSAVSNVDSEMGTVTFELTGTGLGTTTLIAVLDDKMAECAVAVSPVSVEKVILDKETIDINIYETYALGVKVEPENATNPYVEWSSDNNSVATVSRGVITGVGEGTATITAAVGEVKANCTVYVHAVEAESLTLDVSSRTIAEGETFIVTATVLPEDVTYKDMTWSIGDKSVATFEVIDVAPNDNIVAAKVAGIYEGETVLTVRCGKLTAECAITVTYTEDPSKEPEVGDYYYSDGTWSDGKHQPKADKTVIGIVYSTDASRISDAEKALGYTHGLVMCAKTAHAADKIETMYSLDSDFDVVPAKKLGTSWYADINGYAWTRAIAEAYPGEAIRQCPAFDWVITDFKPSAPVNTSGWYIPSIGQLWDMLANLGGDEVAEYLNSLQTLNNDITYYASVKKLSYNPIDKLNSWLEKVPDADKDLYVGTLSRGNGVYVSELMSSTLYENTGDGAVCIFWLYDNNQIEPSTDWTQQPMFCRPILSF